ncbi:MAG: ABC transporter ATP-binding protein [Desulfurococcales archaeon]|nr:ABC transporter ATP-binding protein [Desulfurococcales archaeon]
MAYFVAERVWKTYGRTVALRDVSLEMGEGLNVVVGPNGSGKSTLVKILLGLAKPSKGRAYSFGLDPWINRDKLLKMVGAAMEGVGLPWWMSGRDLLRLTARSRGVGWSVVREVAEYLGVTDYWGKAIASYSMGMRKKLALSIALATATEALVLDEPFTLLDSKTRRRLDQLIAGYSKRMPVILVTHIVTPSVLEARRAALLVNGVLEQFESIDSARVRDLACNPPDVVEAAKGVLAAGRVAYLEMVGGRLIVSFEGEVDPVVAEKYFCRPTLYRLLRYEEFLEEGHNGS